MTFDIAIGDQDDEDPNEDSYTDGSNDLATVSGERRLEQHVYLNVGKQLERLLSGKLTGGDIERVESALETGLDNAEDIGNVLEINVDEYDKEKSILRFSVQAQSGTTELAVTV